MPETHRPMRRANRELTNKDELKGIVERATVVRVGFTDEEGMAIVPMNYGFEWDEAAEGAGLTLWLHSAGEGRKADTWGTSPEVAIELDVEAGVTTGDYSCAYSYAYESIMGTGRISPVADKANKLHGLELIMAHMAPDAPVRFSGEAVERVAVWRVDLTHFTGKRREA